MMVPENGTVPLDTTSRSKTIPPGAPPDRDLIDTAHLCFIINKQHTPKLLVFRAVPKPTTAANDAFANSLHPSPLLHDVVSHTLRGRRRSFGCCGSVLSTAQGSCTRDLCRDIEGKQPLLTTSSCRGGASYKQGQGAAP